MNKFWAILAALLLVAIFSHGQISNGKNIRTLSTENPTESQPGVGTTPQSVRIENSKVWVNGNLLVRNDLPNSLQNIDPEFKMQMTTTSRSDFRLLLFGKQYLLRNGRLMEVPSEGGYATPSNNESSYQGKEDLFSSLKNEEPDHFYNLKKEAVMYERCMQLVLEYQMAEAKVKDKIREEIRLLLGEQFDMSIRNMEKEVETLDQELQEAKTMIDHRKKNKTAIIDKRLQELTN